MVPLVKQYRMPLKRESLELPAGLVENNEEPRNAAVKELLEETGVKYFRDLIEMPPMILDSGRIENLTYGFLALGVELPTESQQSNAELNTIWLSSETLISHAMSGKIDHMGQVALILWASQAGYI
jgi:8-oxo-dGTP pyrophosphatase MutT (NUDIX family)